MEKEPKGWENTGQALHREFKFPDFASALAFVNQVGELAETAQHHPDIELGWGRVAITLSTHDAGGITDKDNVLAIQINTLLV